MHIAISKQQQQTKSTRVTITIQIGAMGDKDAGGSLRDQAKSKAGNKDITKAVLASPLVIPW